jgi:hypothetical protein
MAHHPLATRIHAVAREIALCCAESPAISDHAIETFLLTNGWTPTDPNRLDGWHRPAPGAGGPTRAKPILSHRSEGLGDTPATGSASSLAV